LEESSLVSIESGHLAGISEIGCEHSWSDIAEDLVGTNAPMLGFPVPKDLVVVVVSGGTGKLEGEKKLSPSSSWNLFSQISIG
jgi:hypothetical protein